MHNLTGETIKSFHRRSVPFSVLSSATTTNSDQNFDQFNFHSLWHWSEFLVVATEEKIDRYLLAGKGFIFSSVRLFIPPVQSGRDFNGLPVKGFQGEGLRSNCCLKPTKKLQLSYGDEYFWPIYGGSRRLGRIAWTVMKLYCIQSYVIKAPINTDSPTPSMMSHSMQIDNYKYVSFCEIHNSFLPIITLKLSEIRMENSSLLLPDLKSGCCDSTIKKLFWVKISEVPVKKNQKLPKQNAYNEQEEAVPVGDFH
ncbi:BnaC06g40950D [Brassica napus]|uniref:(rape) hypothetical protein n=1 Tax=Brassica napus TaxID=3708 RepID=A0A078JBD4_BRANA|nr:unnamed protein product [Brassica napus]CDY63014.1 BnaC06g40950D [Brassica napus]